MKRPRSSYCAVSSHCFWQLRHSCTKFNFLSKHAVIVLAIPIVLSFKFSDLTMQIYSTLFLIFLRNCKMA